MTARAWSFVVLGLAAVTPLTGAFLTGLEGREAASAAGILHLTCVGLLAICAVGQSIGLRGEHPRARLANALVLVLMALESVIGRGRTAALSDAIAVVHATLAAVIVGVCAVIPDMLLAESESVPLAKGRLVRSISKWLPPLALLQIVFGALYRHKIWGVLPHMGGALVVALLSLIVSAVLLQEAPSGSGIRSAGAGVLSAVLTQITLGVAAFVMRLLEADSTVAFTIIAALHVATGSAVFFTVCILEFRVQKIAFGES